MLHDDVESMAADIPLAEKVRGYPKLAGQMGLRPEVAIFRRFGALNAENLLYFQAELALLERDLQEQQREDSRSKHPRKCRYALSWYELSTSEHNGDQRQLQLVYRIRQTLKQYSRFAPREVDKTNGRHRRCPHSAISNPRVPRAG